MKCGMFIRILAVLGRRSFDFDEEGNTVELGFETVKRVSTLLEHAG